MKPSIDFSKNIVISLTDLISGFRKKKHYILLCGACLGILFFSYKLLKPIRYTSKGTFKVPTQTLQRGSPTLESMISSNFAFLPKEEPLYFLKSYPVLEEVVKNLNLQGCVAEKPEGRCKRIWKSLRTQQAHMHYRRQRPLSPLLSKKSLVPSRLLFADPNPPLTCDAVTYSKDIYQKLKVVFKDNTHFSLVRGKNSWEGELGLPLHWEGNSFTLHAATHSALKGKKFTLTFIPLETAVEALGQNLKLCYDKKSSHALSLSYTHSNRYLSAAVVNAVMQEYQNYLYQRNKQKADKQNAYFQQRTQELLQERNLLADKEKEALSQRLTENNCITLKEEITYFKKQQSAYDKQLAAITTEMQNLYLLLKEQETSPPLSDILTYARQQKPPNPITTSLASAKEVLAHHELNLEKILSQKKSCDFSREKLFDSSFNPLSLAELFTDAFLHASFQTLSGLQQKLADKQHWSAKERENMQEEIQKQKTFLSEHLHHTKERLSLQEASLKETIFQTRNLLLFLLSQEYAITDHHLKAFALKFSHIPKAWTQDQQLHCSKQMQDQTYLALTKLIEAEKLSHHSTYIDAFPLKIASPPTLPDPPRLILFFLTGFFLGVSLGSLAILANEALLGPSASLQNVKYQNLNLMGVVSPQLPTLLPSLKKRDVNALRCLASSLCNHRLCLCLSQEKSAFTFPLAALLTKRGKKVLILDFAKNPPSSPREEEVAITKNEDYDLCCLENLSFYGEEFLSSHRFEQFLTKLKQSYDLLLIHHHGQAQDAETQQLLNYVEGVCFLITQERLQDLSLLPSATYFLIQEDVSYKKAPLPPKKHLRKLIHTVYDCTPSLK